MALFQFGEFRNKLQNCEDRKNSIMNDFLFTIIVNDPINIDNKYGKGNVLIDTMVVEYDFVNDGDQNGI